MNIGLLFSYIRVSYFVSGEVPTSCLPPQNWGFGTLVGLQVERLSLCWVRYRLLNKDW